MHLRERFFREPLVWFLFLGALIFVLDRSLDDQAMREISIDQGVRDRLSMAWQASYGRAPTSDELRALIETHIVEEMLFREALALGLDKEDQIVRRRLTQKMRFLSEDALPSEPAEETVLREWFAQRQHDYLEPARVSFRHVYVNPSRNEAATKERLAAISRALEASLDASHLGDPSLLPLSYKDTPLQRVAGDLGTEFAEALATLPARAWSGPVKSAYGLHFVFIETRDEPELPAFEHLRQAIKRDYQAAQRAQANLDFIRGLREKYRVTEAPET